MGRIGHVNNLSVSVSEPDRLMQMAAKAEASPKAGRKAG